jgi:hypothetical protein
MLPGSVSKLTEAQLGSGPTIAPKTDIVRLTGTTTIQNITPAIGGVSQMVILVPVDGAITLGTSGNIAVGIAMAQNRAVWLVYVRTLAKWVINSGV